MTLYSHACHGHITNSPWSRPSHSGPPLWLQALLIARHCASWWKTATDHRAMSAGIFPFFRATFYRWADRWRALAGDIAAAPTVLAVGDLHVENFGTWRDAEGR